jgi:hypothetical protein
MFFLLATLAMAYTPITHPRDNLCRNGEDHDLHAWQDWMLANSGECDDFLGTTRPVDFCDDCLTETLDLYVGICQLQINSGVPSYLVPNDENGDPIDACTAFCRLFEDVTLPGCYYKNSPIDGGYINIPLYQEDECDPSLDWSGITAMVQTTCPYTL